MRDIEREIKKEDRHITRHTLDVNTVLHLRATRPPKTDRKRCFRNTHPIIGGGCTGTHRHAQAHTHTEGLKAEESYNISVGLSFFAVVICQPEKPRG